MTKKQALKTLTKYADQQKRHRSMFARLRAWWVRRQMAKGLEPSERNRVPFMAGKIWALKRVDEWLANKLVQPLVPVARVLLEEQHAYVKETLDAIREGRVPDSDLAAESRKETWRRLRASDELVERSGADR